MKVEVSGKVVWGGGEQNIRRGVSRPPLSPSIQLSVPSAGRTDWVQHKKGVLAEPPQNRRRDPRQAPATEGTKVPRAPPVLPVSPLLSNPLTCGEQAGETSPHEQRPSSRCYHIGPASSAESQHRPHGSQHPSSCQQSIPQRPIDAPLILSSSTSLDSSFQTTISDKRPTTNATLTGTSCSSS